MQLFRAAETLDSSERGKRLALHEHFSQVANRHNCLVMRELLERIKSQSDLKDRVAIVKTSRFIGQCEYQPAQAVAMVAELTPLHPEVSVYWSVLGSAMAVRTDGRFLEQAYAAYVKAVDLEKHAPILFPAMNLARVGAGPGRHNEAVAAQRAALAARTRPSPSGKPMRARSQSATSATCTPRRR